MELKYCYRERFSFGFHFSEIHLMQQRRGMSNLCYQLNELSWGCLIFTTINLLTQRKKFQDTWIINITKSYKCRLFLVYL